MRVATILNKKRIYYTTARSISSDWRDDLKYYVPLCPRPGVPVTIKMLDSIDSLESDKEMIKKCKHQLQSDLTTYLGSEIVRDSPHLYYGQLMRCVFYVDIAVFLIPGDPVFDVFIAMFFFAYGVNAFLVLQESLLHKKYKILIE